MLNRYYAININVKFRLKFFLPKTKKLKNVLNIIVTVHSYLKCVCTVCSFATVVQTCLQLLWMHVFVTIKYMGKLRWSLFNVFFWSPLLRYDCNEINQILNFRSLFVILNSDFYLFSVIFKNIIQTMVQYLLNSFCKCQTYYIVYDVFSKDPPFWCFVSWISTRSIIHLK